MELEFWASTDVGRVRDHNEDNFLVDKRMHLFVVCDGMGGHAAGEVASAMSVKVVREVISEHREVFERLEADPENLANRKSVLSLLEHAIQEACARIYQQAQEDSSKRGMGTTCSLLMLAQGRGFIGHVGDSRIYLFREDQIHQITEDHSLINEMIRLGKIKPGEEHHLPHKNAVTRAVGVNEFVEVDTFELDVQRGDAFLLCSDGLSGYFKQDTQIVDLMELEEPKTITEKAIAFANAGGGKDNITAIVVRVTGDDSQKRDIQRTMELLKATPFFQYLAYKEMVQIVNVSKRVELQAGERLFADGDDPGAMYVVASGKIRLDRASKTIGTLLPGDNFAEAALIDETPQRFGATAAEKSAVLSFRRDRFMELLRQEPNLAVKLLWNFLQTLTYRMRNVPYEAFLGERAQKPDENTPPTGTLVFDEDRRRSDGHQPASVSGEFVVPPAESHSGERSLPEAEKQDEPEVDRSKRTIPARPSKVGAAKAAKTTIPPTQPETPALDPDKTIDDSAFDTIRSIKDTIPAGSALVTDELAWDDIVPPDLLDEDEESLRKTVQMDKEVDDKARTHEALTRPSKPVASPAANPNGAIGKPISGESVVRNNPPAAQVLKRTKLVVGEDGFDREREKTRDVPQPVDNRRGEADTTLELDIVDENVEEFS